ncbi:hypothetical protein AAH446_13680 [Erwinia sp. P6884]|uniref:hypothetical protein n=1 Tax=Erwinia sp. P6884 TaxID=3141450 RepID=UPI003199E5B8
MALHGKFIVNDADYSSLSFPGLGTFLTFSGKGVYRHRGGCRTIPEMGSVPAEKQWIADGPEGCITLPHETDFALLCNALLKSQKRDVPCARDLKVYGTIKVMANGKTCL